MKRVALAPAIIIFIIGIIVVGFVMIVFDQVFQIGTTFINTGPFAIGYYSSTVTQFFQLGWYWMPVGVVIGFSIWLYLRAQESSVEAT